MSTGGKGREQPAAALLTWVTVGSAAVTLAALSVPFVRFAYRAPVLHIGLETADALVALLVGYLVYGRYQQGRRLQEFLLVLGLGTVAIANLVLITVPSRTTDQVEGQFSGWAEAAIRLLGTLLITGAALVAADRRVSRRRSLQAFVLLGGLLVAGVGIGLLWSDDLPPLVGPSADPSEIGRPLLDAHPLLLASEATSAVLYAVSAFAFSRRSDRRHDELFRWVGAGCVLAAASRVHYVLFPSLFYSSYVTTGDLLRLGFYLLLLVGGVREIRSYWDLRTRAAVLEARRRIARDLHDGLAQELSFLWSQSRALVGVPATDDAVERISGAAARALDEARRAIAALTRPLDEPFARVLEQLTDDLGSRYDVAVVTTADQDVEVTAAHGEALLRIAAEAVRNAVRHGSATKITVVLAARPLCLSITDDGAGFPTGRRPSQRAGGFGLTSMRERAQAIGAEFSITSSPGNGTTVQVVRR